MAADKREDGGGVLLGILGVLVIMFFLWRWNR